MNTLSSLCGSSRYVFGSRIDIVGVKDKKVNHSWHQDSGLEQLWWWVSLAVIILRVSFSHAIQLSHRLSIPENIDEPRLWIQMRDFFSNTGNPDNIRTDPNSRTVGTKQPSDKQTNPWALPVDEKYILRPMYWREREIMVFDDRDISHSAPDFADRQPVYVECGGSCNLPSLLAIKTINNWIGYYVIWALYSVIDASYLIYQQPRKPRWLYFIFRNRLRY